MMKVQTGKLVACLKTLGFKPNMQNFSERKKVQKLIYLIQEVARIPLGFDFSWYHHGPYSPGLTKVLFELEEGKVPTDEILSKSEVERLNALKVFLREDMPSADNLELLGSLHYLFQAAKRFGVKEEEAYRVLKIKKPYFSDSEIEKAGKKLRLAENF